MRDLVTRALNLAHAWHQGQKDYQGLPYIFHPIRVMDRLRRRGYGDVTLAAALLHDVVEDTQLELDHIKELFPEDVITLVDAVSRREGETYNDFILRLVDTPGAAAIKVADMEDNSDITRSTIHKAAPFKRYAKYYQTLKTQERLDARR